MTVPPDERIEGRKAPLAERLRDRIRTGGPIGFAEFMEAALYDSAEGFFTREGDPSVVGPEGHFVTGPHLSPVFGLLVARHVEDVWRLLGNPDPFTVVEAGAGDGTLARQIAEALDPPIARAIRYVAVERSEPARRRLEGVSGSFPALEVAASMEKLDPVDTGCLLANEVLDNLPFHLLRRDEEGLRELLVDDDGEGGFRLVQGPQPPREVAAIAPALAPGQTAGVSLEAVRFVEQAAALLQRGYVWLVDYGYADGEPPTQVHSYLGQRQSDDVLADPGSRDITAGVDFDALAARGRSLGLSVWGPITQREALLYLGFRELDGRARRLQVEALGAGRGIDALRIYSNRNRANLLLGRSGLGSFHVLCMGVGTTERPRSMGGA